MNQTNSKKYWEDRFSSGDWSAEGGSAQSLFFAKVAYSVMPEFLKRELGKNQWTVLDIGCALGDGTAYLAKQFPVCQFTGQDFSEDAISQAVKKYPNCNFEVANIYDGVKSADVVFSSNTLEHLKDASHLMRQMCSAASKYVIHMLPLEDSLDLDEHVNVFNLDTFPLHMDNFYLEAYCVADCSEMEHTCWAGQQILLVYTNQDYRPEEMTLQDVHENYVNMNRKRMREMASLNEEMIRLLEESNRKFSDMNELCYQRGALLDDANARIVDIQKQLQDVRSVRTAEEEKRIQEEVEARFVTAQGQYRRKLSKLEADLKRLQMESDHQKNQIKQLTDHIVESRNALWEISNAVAVCRKWKPYKLLVVYRRFKQQCISGENIWRGDFFRWLWSKIAKRVYSGSPLCVFDVLYPAEHRLMQQIGSVEQTLAMEMSMQPMGIIPKNGRRFFIFAGVPYYDVGGGQRFAQIASTLNQMGYSVYYVYGFESSESKRENMYIPTVKHVHLDHYSVNELAGDIQDDSVLIFEIPYGKFKPYLDYANAHGNATLYEHVDNWDSSLGCTFYNKDDYAAFIRDVQYITVTARVLGEKIEEAGRSDYCYCANAVDSSLFEPSKTYARPADLVQGNKTLLYFGSLWGEWFDWDLLIYVAEHCDCAINLIGDYQPIASKIKKLPKNIHFLGIKKHEELPAYLHFSDIALLPFKNSIIGKYVSPLKVFEYIAMNKPVLATPLDDIIGYPNVICTEDKQEWARVVDQGMELVDTTVFTNQNSWYARCNQILDLVGRPEAERPSVSIVILNHNNKKVIFRCVSSLLAFSSAYDHEIIVVDNDSTDGSYELLQEKYGDQIKLVKNSKNGCSSGRNLGVKHATGELLLFLDSDQWVIGEHYIDAAYEVLEQNPQVGGVGWAAGWFEKDSVAGPIADYLPNRGIKGPWAMCRTDIAYLGSGGLLMRKSLFDQVGGFDEYFDPTCFEDTDLSLKIRHAGYELAYCPYMTIMHLPHQTTQSGSAQHAKLMARNSSYFMDKWKKADPTLLEYYL